MLEAVLGGPVDTGTRRRLVERTGGNLLFLREVVRVGLGRGALVERGNVWMWDGPITDAPAVADLVRGRLAALDAIERHVVDVVALSEPIGVSLLNGLCDPAAVQSCETKGIVVTAAFGTAVERSARAPALCGCRARRDEPRHVDGARERRR